VPPLSRIFDIPVSIFVRGERLYDVLSYVDYHYLWRVFAAEVVVAEKGSFENYIF